MTKKSIHDLGRLLTRPKDESKSEIFINIIIIIILQKEKEDKCLCFLLHYQD